MSDADPVLFELLNPPPKPPELAEPRLGAINTKWTRYTGKTHMTCDHCIKLIHELGANEAPWPRPARHKRVGPNDTLMLCDVHGEEMRRKDREVEAEHARRLARAAEMRKAHAGTRRK